ncbi:MAG: hypothetical protein WCY34_03930 [Candidatus Omnitrophota bacterium]|jgi:predicted nucleic acid-binding Zn ribbon protein
MAEGKFDYQSFSQEQEGLDFGKMKKCPHCSKPIPGDAISCYYCGKLIDDNDSARPAWFVWTAIAIVVVFFLFFLLFL